MGSNRNRSRTAPAASGATVSASVDRKNESEGAALTKHALEVQAEAAAEGEELLAEQARRDEINRRMIKNAKRTRNAGA